MKAYGTKDLLGGLSLNFNADKKIKHHKNRLAKIKGNRYHNDDYNYNDHYYNYYY
jgi:hypothetical protein